MAQRKPTYDEYLEQAYEDAQSDGGSVESDRPVDSVMIEDEDDDEALAAWLAERETELLEQTFGLADPYDGDWRL